MKKNLSQLTMHNAQLTIKRKRSPLSIVNYPLSIAIAALLLLLVGCDKEELGPGASPAAVVINATSVWETGFGASPTRAVKESFAVGDKITITYAGVDYEYILTTFGWQPTGTALSILLTATEPKATGTCKDAEGNELTAPETDFTLRDGKEWVITLAFAYTKHGAIDLTLLKAEDFSELTDWENVAITIGGTATVFTKAKTVGGIVLPVGSISKIEIDTNGNTDAYEYTADISGLISAAKTVVKGKRHAMTVVVTKVVTP